jgi:hypothetical protein
MNWLNKLPTLPFAIISIWLAVAPIVPQPHLVQKLNMLFSGVLSKPIDIFDLVLHGTPITLLIIKLVFLNKVTD